MAVRLFENKYSIFNYDDKNIIGQIEEELYQNFRKKFLATQINYEEFLGELFDFSLNKVDGFISSQKSAFFFFEILKFHESLTELNNKFPHQLHERYGLDNNFCAMSRKVLKVLLEGACDIELNLNPINSISISEDLTRICLWIEKCYHIQELISYLRLDKNSVDICIDSINCRICFQINKRLVEYGKELVSKALNEYGNFATNTNGFAEFASSVKEAFNLDLRNFIETLSDQIGDNFGLAILKDNMESFFIENNYDLAFLHGLIINRENRQTLHSVIEHPYDINRYLYKPILQWRVDNQEMFYITKASLEESIHHFITHLLPWDKVPQQWGSNLLFSNYIIKLKAEHEDWLNNKILLALQSNFSFLSNVKSLNNCKLPNNGQIDFVFIEDKNKTIYVVEAKNLHASYDATSWAREKSKFEKVKGHNHQLEKYLLLIQNEFKENLIQELKLKYSTEFEHIRNYETVGLFVINTPILDQRYSKYEMLNIVEFEDRFRS